MALLDLISYYINLVMIIVLLLIGAGGLALFYLFKIKKVAANQEVIDYSSFRREDSREYAKFVTLMTDNSGNSSGNSNDDSKSDGKSAGVVYMGNHRYVAGISISGFDFSTASAGEQQRTMLNSITFLNVVDEKIQLRQTSKAIDLSDNIEQYKNILEKFSLEGMQLQEEYKNTLRMAEDYEGLPEEEAYTRRLQELQRLLNTKNHFVEEAEAVLEYMNRLSGGEQKVVGKINQLMFSYVYNPDEDLEVLTEQEIEHKAMLALQAKAVKYADALGRCGCSCKRLSASDVALLMYKHLHPYTADNVTLNDLFNDSYENLFITSDSLVELEKIRIGEEEYEQRLQAFYAEQRKLSEKREVEAEHLTQKLLKEAQLEATRRLAVQE